MTNIDRATEHMDSLDRLYAYASGNQPSNAERAQALADAGYLMPDLPEPVEKDGLFYFGDDDKTYAFPDGRVVVIQDDSCSYPTAEELRTHALVLLAAADYAERNQ